MPATDEDAEFMSTRETRMPLCYETNEGAISHLRKSGLKPIRRGRCLLWRRSEVFALIGQDRLSPPR